MRTTNETSILVEATIKEIRKHRIVSDALIADVCNRNNITEEHIRRVAYWHKQGVNQNYYLNPEDIKRVSCNGCSRFYDEDEMYILDHDYALCFNCSNN
jgi:hypothetical protein